MNSIGNSSSFPSTLSSLSFISRINIEVLSVVAQQITSILNAMTTLKSDIEVAMRTKMSTHNMSEEDAYATMEKRYLTKKFTFQGQDIDLVWSCGLFITMNPGM